MSAVNKLLDMARETCSPPTWTALAERLGVRKQLVSQWRNGVNPVADDRVTQLAKMAHQDPSQWLVAVSAEQASGETARFWQAAAKRMGFAAAVVLGFAASAVPTPASAAQGWADTSHNVYNRALAWLVRAIRGARRVKDLQAGCAIAAQH